MNLQLYSINRLYNESHGGTNSLIGFTIRIMDGGVCMEFLYWLSVYLFHLTIVFHVKLSELSLCISNITWLQPCRKLYVALEIHQLQSLSIIDANAV